MFLRTNLTNRRQFLGRSALGAGSLLFAPLLLDSCTDHRIPPTTIDPAPLTFAVDWNDDAKAAVATAIGEIPVAGDLLGLLVNIFWPDSTNNVWDGIRDDVEKLVDQKIDTVVYNGALDELTGLKNLINDYRYVLNPTNENGNPQSVDYGTVMDKWNAIDSGLSDRIPKFQSTGYELLLLPLFAQFANLYLAIYRDAVAFGKSWGFKDVVVDYAYKKLIGTDSTLVGGIAQFISYTTKWYNSGRNDLQQKTKADAHNIEPFKTVNNYDRQMSQTVLVFMDMWPYYDVTQYPNGTKVVYSREIYSDPFGTADNSGPIVLPSAPTQSPTHITVWGYDRIDAVQVTYPAGGGPGGVTQTARMGDQNGGTTQSPYGDSFDVAPQQIMAAKVTYGSIINSMQFKFGDGTMTPMMGGKDGSNVTDWIGYPDTFLSSVYINGVSDFYGSADLVVFGFQYWTTPTSQLNAIEALYVTSPKERSAADFAKEFPDLTIPADLITETLKASRKKHWEAIEARVKKPK